MLIGYMRSVVARGVYAVATVVGYAVANTHGVAYLARWKSQMGYAHCLHMYHARLVVGKHLRKRGVLAALPVFGCYCFDPGRCRSGCRRCCARA